jgi:16S rRNA (guanine527-N7)-methyltransferase
MDALSPQDFQIKANVSRETFDKLSRYAECLIKWQKAINLVSKSTLDDLWARHFLDSAQLYDYIMDAMSKDGKLKEDSAIVDLGSGAGFPGLVLAIMGVENVHLVESDQRKCLFLKEVARLCGVSVQIHSQRIEDCHIENIGIITARALGSLEQLLGYGAKLTKENTENDVQYFFLKGARVKEEITQAQKNWLFKTKEIQSKTDDDARILHCFDVRPV